MGKPIKKQYAWMPYDKVNDEYWAMWAQYTKRELLKAIAEGCSSYSLIPVRVEIKKAVKP